MQSETYTKTFLVSYWFRKSYVGSNVETVGARGYYFIYTYVISGTHLLSFCLNVCTELLLQQLVDWRFSFLSFSSAYFHALLRKLRRQKASCGSMSSSFASCYPGQCASLQSVSSGTKFNWMFPVIPDVHIGACVALSLTAGRFS